MPGFNGTGPMTGGGRGFCNPYGRSYGGRSFGGGRGSGNGTPLPDPDIIRDDRTL